MPLYDLTTLRSRLLEKRGEEGESEDFVTGGSGTVFDDESIHDGFSGSLLFISICSLTPIYTCLGLPA